MSELKAYDIAASKFYDTLSFTSLPISSWDLYAGYFNAICKNYDDIVTLENLAELNKWDYQKNFANALLNKHYVIVITDPELKIVHATRNMGDMNGYLPEEIIGKKPKMFQGAETCQKTSKNIRLAVQKRSPFEVVIVNYRKDGSTYKCWIKGEPILNTSGEVVNFIAYEKEVA